mmetsp:Transcript_8156/g.20039  ORF Transcript_8156/g.20039 Transcript_8156/m.20039 type:complete len:214 (+) Transcript_8156:2115-2756(+)
MLVTGAAEAAIGGVFTVLVMGGGELVSPDKSFSPSSFGCCGIGIFCGTSSGVDIEDVGDNLTKEEVDSSVFTFSLESRFALGKFVAISVVFSDSFSATCSSSFLSSSKKSSSLSSSQPPSSTGSRLSTILFSPPSADCSTAAVKRESAVCARVFILEKSDPPGVNFGVGALVLGFGVAMEEIKPPGENVGVGALVSGFGVASGGDAGVLSRAN